jgi:hypothetical protein
VTDAREVISALDSLMPTQAVGICLHCDKPIVFKPYFLDGKLPNPPIWFHPPGSRTCATKPKGHRSSWPIAEPKDEKESL